MGSPGPDHSPNRHLKISRLEIKKEIIRLGTTYSLASKHTSYVAVQEKAGAEPMFDRVFYGSQTPQPVNVNPGQRLSSRGGGRFGGIARGGSGGGGAFGGVPKRKMKKASTSYQARASHMAPEKESTSAMVDCCFAKCDDDASDQEELEEKLESLGGFEGFAYASAPPPAPAMSCAQPAPAPAAPAPLAGKAPKPLGGARNERMTLSSSSKDVGALPPKAWVDMLFILQKFNGSFGLDARLFTALPGTSESQLRSAASSAGAPVEVLVTAMVLEALKHLLARLPEESAQTYALALAKAEKWLGSQVGEASTRAALSEVSRQILSSAAPAVAALA